MAASSKGKLLVDGNVVAELTKVHIYQPRERPLPVGKFHVMTVFLKECGSCSHYTNQYGVERCDWHSITVKASDTNCMHWKAPGG